MLADCCHGFGCARLMMMIIIIPVQGTVILIDSLLRCQVINIFLVCVFTTLCATTTSADKPEHIVSHNNDSDQLSASSSSSQQSKVRVFHCTS